MSSPTPSQSPSPSDTTNSPPFPPPPRSSPNSGFGSIFQSPGGPPLILVCIAAGLLLGAFIGVLLMRRMRPPVVVQRMGAGRGRGAVKLGEKPKLLDIHLGQRTDVSGSSGSHSQDAEGKASGAARWAYIFPFAAIYLPSSIKTSSSGGSPSQPSPSNANANLNPVSRLLTRLRHRDRRAHDRAAHASSAGPSPSSPARLVQFAVTVSMPDPRQPTYMRPGSRAAKENEKEKEAGLRDDDPTSNEPYAHDRHAPNAHHEEEEELSMPDCCIGTFIVQYTPPADAAPVTQTDTRTVTTSTSISSTPTTPTPPLTVTGRAASPTTAAAVMLPLVVQSAQTRHLPFTVSR